MTTLVWLFFGMSFTLGWWAGSKWAARRYKRVLKEITKDILEVERHRVEEGSKVKA